MINGLASGKIHLGNPQDFIIFLIYFAIFHHISMGKSMVSPWFSPWFPDVFRLMPRLGRRGTVLGRRDAQRPKAGALRLQPAAQLADAPWGWKFWRENQSTLWSLWSLWIAMDHGSLWIAMDHYGSLYGSLWHVNGNVNGNMKEFKQQITHHLYLGFTGIHHKTLLLIIAELTIGTIFAKILWS